jgi:hypothetical protein
MWCCDSHRLEFEFTNLTMVKTKLEQVVAEVRSAVDKADITGDHILPRAALRCVIKSQMEDHNMVYPVELIERMLDKSMATWEEVVIQKEWARVGDNAKLYDGIPHIAYSVDSFTRLLSETICDEDTRRKYLVRDVMYNKK